MLREDPDIAATQNNTGPHAAPAIWCVTRLSIAQDVD